MTPPTTVLLTLGRLPVALDIARAFAERGTRVVIADPWRTHLGSVSNSVAKTWRTASPSTSPTRYRAELEAIARVEKAELIIPVSEETVAVSKLVGRVGPGVFCGDFAHTLALHDKLDFIRLAESHGLRVPETAADAADCRDGVAYTIKPRQSCGGAGVRFVDADEKPEPGKDEIAQATVTGREISVFCIARDGDIAAMSAYASELRDGAVAIAFEAIECASATDWASQFVSAIGHTGFIAFDFIVDDEDVAWPIECNPRVTSGIHLVSRDAIYAAITGEETSVPTEAAPTRRMEFYSCFSQLFKNILKPAALRKVFAVIRSHRDVTWAADDKKPFLLMMIVNWRLLWTALRDRQSYARASVADLEYRGERD